MVYGKPGSGIANGRDERRLAWLARQGTERHAQHEGHYLHASHVDGHTREPQTDQPATTDTGKSSQEDQ